MYFYKHFSSLSEMIVIENILVMGKEVGFLIIPLSGHVESPQMTCLPQPGKCVCLNKSGKFEETLGATFRLAEAIVISNKVQLQLYLIFI